MEILITCGMIYVLFKVCQFAIGALTDLITWSAKFLAFIVVVGIAYSYVQAQGLFL